MLKGKSCVLFLHLSQKYPYMCPTILLYVTWKARSVIVVQHPFCPTVTSSIAWSACWLQLRKLVYLFNVLKYTICNSSNWANTGRWSPWRLTVGVEKTLYNTHWLCLWNHFHFWMFHVCLCRRPLFQRKKRSVSMKKKKTRKSLSKTKARPLNFLASKKSPAKKFAAKKKQQMPGYQATAPARPRGNFRVNGHVKKRPDPIKIFLP